MIEVAAGPRLGKKRVQNTPGERVRLRKRPEARTGEQSTEYRPRK